MGNTTTTNHLIALFPRGLAGKRIHAMGAGGIGMSAVIQLALAQGAVVTGCDVAESSMGRYLRELGVPIAAGHDPAHLAGAGVDLLVNAPAVTALNPDQAEITAARAAGIPTADWQELLGYLMAGRIGVSVAGVHGKGSTTALLGALAVAGGLDPTVEVGAVVPVWGSNVRVGHGRWFINEADEWNYNFLHYHPRVAVLTAVEYDHPEFFASYEAIREAFERFIAGMDMAPGDGAAPLPPPTLILNADNPGCRDIRERLGARWPGRVGTFGIESAEADVRALDPRVAGTTSFALVLDGRNLGRATLATPGLHSVYNALAAVAAAHAIGVASDVHVAALSAFGGLRRRFEVTRDTRGITYVDDYAHHPHAVALTLETARLRFPGQRLVAVFQPTLYTRLQRFLEPFSAAFDAAASVGIVEIQPSRERDTGLIHGRDLVGAIQARPAFAGKADEVFYGGTFAETVAALRERLRPDDVLVVMGSGPVNRIIPPLRDAAG
ncbi:MAG TPA: UDP-N-acetylmuramate--L-alanine ligase [Ktedonobacterales bacterium]|nr:UDP-N-acetylmuramate--L-alanine ligase [Ktedonobacterales bacterium]